MKVFKDLKALLRPKEFKVRVAWDSEAEVWYVCDSDVPGLSTEATSIDSLIAKLQVMVPELLVLNGIVKAHDHEPPMVPYELMIKQFQTARAAGC